MRSKYMRVNQCMGCQADWPMINATMHRKESMLGEMVQCTKYLYPPEQPNPDDKSKSKPEDAWKWIPTSFNVSTLSMKVLLRTDSTIFLRLPRELWRSCGRCICPSCVENKRAEGWWDTLAIALNKPAGNDFSWVVHMPEVPR
jgi:hypothetical protein